MSRCIAVASAKGGVGKTTVALNLAAALASFGYGQVLVDANFSALSIKAVLGNTKSCPKPSKSA